MITSAYPNYDWLPWKFSRTSKGFWKNEDNVKKYMNWLSQELNIKTMEDWYKVSYEVKSNDIYKTKMITRIYNRVMVIHYCNTKTIHI